MTSSSMIMNLDSTTSSPESLSRKKRKRKNLNSSPSLYNQKQLIQTNKWKSESKQRIYSTKLLDALHRVRNTSSSSSSSSSLPRGGRAVREAADRALAFEAKGKTRWSRAILTSRIKLKLKKVNKPRLVIDNENSNKKKKAAVRVPVKVSTKVPVLQKKVRVLGRLVPGCRKVSFPDLLEEATDYIAAMEMQVKAMTALAELLSGLGSSTSTSSTTTTTNNNSSSSNNNNTDRVYHQHQHQHQHPTISLAGSESFDVMPGVVLGNPPPL
ncbi:hypothetical protein MKW94_016069 [Papaver nudicaule]|uniref:IBH1-like N-terminal domain-containing protein n=2 Tax=Papaver nudicaule TaxID=74823 RepID=A0AA42B4L5_PAPNU|nr:hypothetical protein [Papaver nudicaule]